MINIVLSVVIFVVIKWTFLKVVTALHDAGSSGLMTSASRSSSVVRGKRNSGGLRPAHGGPLAFGQRREAEPHRDFDQIGKGVGLHLLHYSTPVCLHGGFTDPELSTDFLIRKSGNHQG